MPEKSEPVPCIIFDAGPIINLTLNNLLWILPHLKQMSGLRLCIPSGVETELITKPLNTKKYKLEALQILPYINNGTLEVIDDKITREKAAELDPIFNKLVIAHGKPVVIVHDGELHCIAAHLTRRSAGIIIDERTTRYLIETPSLLRKRMERKLHTKVTLDKEKLAKARTILKGISCLRSVELIAVAFNEGIFAQWYEQSVEHIDTKDLKRDVLQALLWALKLHGCAISEQEVIEMESIIMRMQNSKT